MASISLSTVKSFVIVTLALGTITSPVPFARSSNGLLLSVVVIKLSSIKILPLLISPAILKLPVCVTFPTCVMLPLTVVSFKLVVPLTVKFCSITTSLPLILTSPEPAASILRSVFGVNTVILLLLISIVLFVKFVALIVVPINVFASIALANKLLLILKLSFVKYLL